MSPGARIIRSGVGGMAKGGARWASRRSPGHPSRHHVARWHGASTL